MRQALVGCALLAAAVSGCRDRRGAEEPSYEAAYTHAQHQREYAEWAMRRQELSQRLPAVEKMVIDAFTAKKMPSLAVALVVDGQLAWWRGFGVRDLEEGGAITPHTVYRIGSITKVVTAMALLKLRDDGKVSLDAPAAGYLPEIDSVAAPNSERSPITLRQLMTHTSGLPRLGGFDYAGPRREPVGEREVLEALRSVRLEHPPGTVSSYSNLGYALLGIIVGRIAGEPYRDYVSREILAPIGMASAVWDAGAVPRDRLATGYAGEGGYQPSHEWLMGAAEGMGGLYASLDDMVRFVSYHMTAWPPGGRRDQPPLSNATLRESHLVFGFARPGPVAMGAGWSLLAQSGSGHVVHHNGATATYAAKIAFVPEARVGFIALANSGSLADTLDSIVDRSLNTLLGTQGPRLRGRGLLRR